MRERGLARLGWGRLVLGCNVLHLRALRTDGYSQVVINIIPFNFRWSLEETNKAPKNKPIYSFSNAVTQKFLELSKSLDLPTTVPFSSYEQVTRELIGCGAGRVRGVSYDGSRNPSLITPSASPSPLSSPSLTSLIYNRRGYEERVFR